MTLQATSTIRLGFVNYLNALPFYHELETFCESSGMTLSLKKGSPTELNGSIREGNLDISLVSSLEYGRNAENYYLLPHYCIGANQISRSVLFVSKCPLAELDGKIILLSDESLSSQILLKILLSKSEISPQYKSSPQEPDRMLKQGDACLLIGDGALYHQVDPSLYIYDLSQLWYQLTYLPFCFAVWVVRREFADENRELVFDFWNIMRQVFEKNLKDPAPMAASLNGSSNDDQLLDDLMKVDKFFGYVSHLSYDFNEDMAKGLLQYFAFAVEEGELERLPNLEFLTK